MGDALYELMAEGGWNGAKACADARRDAVVVRNGVELKGALASTVVGRKSGNREKETLRWASKGINIAKVANHAPTQEEADRAGPGFLPALTLRMRARLQGFPSWWSFVGGKESASHQIGNAVPPVIGSAIGLAVRAAITNRDYDYATLLPRDPAAMVDEFRRLFYPDAPSVEPDLGEVMGLGEPVA
jgi:DNA (cytosine-5)-methyltransferase 1